VLLVLAAFGSLTGGVVSPQTGQYEPNDGMSQAYGPLKAGMAYNGAIDTDNDNDWFVFYPKSQEQITLTARDTSPSTSPCGALDVSLKDRRGNTIANKRLNPNMSTDFRRTLDRGTYYFVVQNFACSPESYSFGIQTTGELTTAACVDALSLRSRAAGAVRRYKSRLLRARTNRTRRSARRKLRSARHQLSAAKRRAAAAC
jgi:hypothetical protein